MDLTRLPPVLSRGQARAWGFPDGRVNDLLQRGVWSSPVRGLLATRPLLPSDHLALAQACLSLVSPAAVLSHTSAALLWGLPLLQVPREVALSVPREDLASSRRGVRVRHALLSGDVLRSGGLPVTSVARTVRDLSCCHGLLAGLLAADAALAEGLAQRSELVVAADAAAGLRGVVTARRVAALADGGAASPWETRLRLLLVDGGLPAPVTQVEVRGAGSRFRGDLGWPSARLLVELDGRAFHEGWHRARQDLQRQNALQAAGWLVLRYAPRDVLSRPQVVVGEVAAAVRHRWSRAA